MNNLYFEDMKQLENCEIGLSLIINDIEEYLKWCRRFRRHRGYEHTMITEILHDIRISKECLVCIMNNVEEQEHHE